MSRLWNGKNLDEGAPELGLRLDSASFVPEFAVQLLESGVCEPSDSLLFTPLDDFKGWLRTQNPGEHGLKHDLRELLLGQEEIDRAKAAEAGIRFDLVDYELGQMQADPSYEHFNAEWARNILALAVEEADSLQAWSRAELGTDFHVAMSFSLPDPRRHPLITPQAVEASLRKFGASEKLVERVIRGQGKRPEYTGSLLLEFGSRGAKAKPPLAGPTAFVVVGLADPRAGDQTDAVLSLAYPRELEGYFLAAFDTLRQRLTLKEEP